MDEEEKNEEDKGDNPSTQDGDGGSAAKEHSDRDLDVPSRQDVSSEVSEVFSEDPLKQEEKEDDGELEDEIKLRILRCLTSSFLAGARCSLHSKDNHAYILNYKQFSL